MFPKFRTTGAEVDVSCSDEDWVAFIQRVEAQGEREIEQMKARVERGEKRIPDPPQPHPGMLYYYQHLMGDDS